MSTKESVGRRAGLTVLAEIRPDLSHVPAWVRDLEAKWRAKAKLLHESGAESHATLQNKNIEELLEAICSSMEAPLTIAEAALESGYSPDHLRRQVREGRYPNAGKKGKPMIMRLDLVKGPRVVPVAPFRQLHGPSRQQVARSLLKRDET